MLGNSFFVVHWTNTDGWDPDEPNPKTTYDNVLIAISRVAEDTVGGLVEEFGGIRLCNFELFQKFLDRLQHLKNCLKSIDIDMGPKAYLWIALIAVKDDFKENYLLWCRDMKNSALTWNSLMEEFSAIAAREEVQLIMASMEPVAATTRNTQTQSPYTGSGRFNNPRQKKHCDQCNRNVNENNTYCNICQKYRPGTIHRQIGNIVYNCR